MGIDKRTVELAKIMFSQGKNKSQIARELQISNRTVGRYLCVQDDPEFADELSEIRHAHQAKYVEDAWEIIHAAADQAKVKIGDPKTSAKDAATVGAIYIDKIRMLEMTGAKEVTEDTTVTFTFKENDGTTSKSLPESDELPQIPCEVPSIDRRVGERENLQLMLGGGEGMPGTPED
jgi:hypothetical protein